MMNEKVATTALAHTNTDNHTTIKQKIRRSHTQTNKHQYHTYIHINDAQIEQFATVAEHFGSLTHTTLELKKMESEEKPREKKNNRHRNAYTETHRHRPNIERNRDLRGEMKTERQDETNPNFFCLSFRTVMIYYDRVLFCTWKKNAD